MERTLSLVLDERGTNSLTLVKGDARKIDTFTSYYEDSENIREIFKDKIDNYLKDNANLIKSIEESTNKKFRGRIVILELDSKNMPNLIERKVLYRKHSNIFSRLINERITITKFCESEIQKRKEKTNYLISDYVLKCLRSNNVYDRNVGLTELRNISKKGSNEPRYEILRELVLAHENARKEGANLLTIDRMYNNYLIECKLRAMDKAKNEYLKTTSEYTKELKELANEHQEPISDYKETNTGFNYDGINYDNDERMQHDIDDNTIPFDGNNDKTRRFL